MGVNDVKVTNVKLCDILAVKNVLVCLSFGAESFVFQVAIQKFKDQDT